MFKDIISKILAKPLNIALIIVIIVFAWMISGIFQEKKEEKVATKDLAPKYKSINSSAQLKAPTLQLTGTTVAKKNVALYAQADGKIVKIFVQSGQRLKAGEPILEIESKNKKEAKEAALDKLQSAKLNYNSVITLYNKGLSSKLELDKAETAVENAKSDLAFASTELAHIIVRAPFDGYIDYINAHEGDIIQLTAGVDLLLANYVSLSDMTVQVNLSEQERAAIARQLELAQQRGLQKISQVSDSSTRSQKKFLVPLEGTNIQKIKIADIIYETRVYNGFLRFVSKVINSNSNTFLLELSIDNDGGALMSGQTVDVVLYGHQTLAHAIPQSALILNEKGNALAVKTIEDNRVRSYDIKVISEDGEGVWVVGLPEKAEIITMGQAYIEDNTAV